MLINIDISTGTMFVSLSPHHLSPPLTTFTDRFKGGPLIDVALDFFNRKGKPELLMPKRSGFPDRERIKLQRFLAGVRVTTNLTGPGSSANQPRVLTGLTPHGAADCKFKDEKGVEKSVKVRLFY
jgi:eukaryotic translation initiation factor 2C